MATRVKTALEKIFTAPMEDGLVIGNKPTDLKTITIKAQATAQSLKRGTIMSLSSKDGKYSIFGTAASEGETLTANVILADDIEVGTAQDEVVAAYKSGKFNKNKTIVKNGSTLTDKDLEALRIANIDIEPVMEY